MVAPLLIEMGKSRSVMRASSTTPSTSAPKLLHQPSISAGPGYPVLPFTQHVPAERSSVLLSKPLPESHLPGSKNFRGSHDSWFHNSILWGRECGGYRESNAPAEGEGFRF